MRPEGKLYIYIYIYINIKIVIWLEGKKPRSKLQSAISNGRAAGT
jgi:hypothetical protein